MEALYTHRTVHQRRQPRIREHRAHRHLNERARSAHATEQAAAQAVVRALLPGARVVGSVRAAMNASAESASTRLCRTEAPSSGIPRRMSPLKQIALPMPLETIISSSLSASLHSSHSCTFGYTFYGR